MIVTCERCATQFQLDDAKLRGEGIRVRCSRCKHAFFVAALQRSRNPSESEVERLVKAALEDSAPEPPDVTRDLEPPVEPPSEVGSEPERGEAPSDESGPESDWQFNDDSFFDVEDHAQIGDDRFAAAREAVDDLLGGSPAPAPPRPAPRSERAVDDGEELGAPEQWDFVGEAMASSAPKPLSPEEAQAPEQADQLASGSGEVSDPIRAEARAPHPIEIDAILSRPSRWLGALVDGVGWTLSAALVLAIGYGQLVYAPKQVDWIPDVQEAAGATAGSLEGRWIENAHGGSLYVVTGIVQPAPSGGPTGEALPALRLVDAAGKAIPGALAVMGPPLTRAQVRESDPKQLAALQIALTRRLVASSPGASRRFLAIFSGVPAQAAGLRLEAMDRPASRPAAAAAPGA